MKRIASLLTLTGAVAFAVLGGKVLTAQDAGDAKYAVKVPGGLAFSEFKGYEAWQTVSISVDGAVHRLQRRVG